jgi:hypothetical protein
MPYSILTDGLVWLMICAIMTDRFVQLAVSRKGRKMQAFAPHEQRDQRVRACVANGAQRAEAGVPL